jgi:hypothetical protein
MSYKHVVFYVGCVVTWSFLLPLFVVACGIALLAYAVLGELGELLVGGTKKTLDNSTAREIARRMCLGN